MKALYHSGSVKFLLLCGFVMIISSSVQAASVTYDLSFDTTGQSIWGPGEAFKLDETVFLGAEWTNLTTNLDLIAGNANEPILNPARIAYDVAYNTCRLLYSHNVYVNGQSAPLGQFSV